MGADPIGACAPGTAVVVEGTVVVVDVDVVGRVEVEVDAPTEGVVPVVIGDVVVVAPVATADAFFLSAAMR